ncbi:S-layer homology domain-containing protein [Dysosmobacter welbionis]
MKKRLLSILLMCCMVLTLLPTAAFAEDNTEESPVCTCETVCTAETMNTECSVCGADGALPESCAKANTGAIAEGAPAQALTSVDITFPAPEADKPVGDGSAVSANADSGLTLYLFGPALWKQGEEPDKLDENATYAEGNTYLLNFTFYTQKPITDETVLTYNGKPITRYADYQALTEALDAYDGKQDAYLGCVLFSAEGTGDPAMEDLKDLYLLSLYAFVRVPEAQIPEDTVDEQFTLTPGGRYYFDLSAMNIPGTVNGNLPDSTLRYVPFTYAGTVNAYKLTSETATTEEYAQQNKYLHSLFIADFAVTNDVSWDALNTAGLIFGKDYAVGGVDYTLRAPSVGSNSTGSGDSQRGVPQSNEWDTMLNKNSGYIQNWNAMYSWGQDAYSTSGRAFRGFNSARFWLSNYATYSNPYVGFRPVLEVLNADTLGSGGLKAVTLDLGGGTLGNSSEDIHIIVKTGSKFTAPASDGMTRPAGDTGSYFMWLGSNGKLYAPGASVPADVTKLTAQFALSEQFALAPGGRYYFDLSAMNIPGTANRDLPDSTLHYVPFTYVGTVNAYSLENEADKDTTSYEHSLFIANYNVTHTVSWDALNTAGLIFGKDYAAGGVDYTLRAPSVGSNSIGSGDSQRGVPQSNEWDTMLNKNSGYIQNWNEMYSWGQDAFSGGASYRAVRGCDSARYWISVNAAYSNPSVGFRPVLEVLNADTLGPDGLKVVTLDLGGGTLGGSSDAIQIIVKNGSEFTAPASDGLNRPAGDTGSYFMWLGSNGKLYAPGAIVPADVTKLTAQFALSEQFSLKPGGTYYFDLSAMGIPGTVNDALPDNTLHYVPFTYAGTVDAYKLTSARATTEEYAQQNKYAHSLFVADYDVTHKVNWNNLDTASLIFGKNYASGGVDYTLRAPSVGSGRTGSDESQRGTPQSNEWDTMMNKDSGYIQNWNGMFSWGQDVSSGGASYRAIRGYFSARYWSSYDAADSNPSGGFRPVLEVLNSDTLGPDGMKAVTLDLGGGTLGGSSDAIQIIVKNGSTFTAPMSGGLTRPDGDTGSYFMWLDGNGNSYEPGGSVPADVTELTVQWTAPTYAVTLHTNGGTINNGNVTEYTYGVGATLPTDVTRTGYTFKGWYDNESLTGSPVTAIGGTEMGNKEYWAKWEINQYTIAYDLAGGTAEGNPDTYTIETGTFTLKNPTKSGYTFTGWSGTGLDGENNMTVTIPTGSTGNRTYAAHWRYNGSGHSYSYYTIKATAGTGGSISPFGNVSVREGRDQTFTITPDKGYAVANVKIDGKSIGAVKSYTFENVRRTHTIEVIFMKANGNPQTGVFVDVATGSYYEDAVDWAVENGITKGTDDTHFSPDGICTRAQAVTFLWRTAGSPKPETRAMPFTDVPVGSYYYDAVLWAVENGITKGTSDTTFSPNMTCTRAQIVAFLWRSEKSPAAGSRNPFADVKSTAYYADAVLWAVKEDITKGSTNTTFSPDADCTRAQIVTFLWRCKK